MRWMRIFGYIIAVASAIWSSARPILDWLGRVDFVIAHRADPGWLSTVAEYLTAPPWWLPWCVLALGLAIIWLNSKRQRLNTSPISTEDPQKEANNAASGVPATGSAAPPSLRRHYEEEDRKRLSSAMYDLYELLNKHVSPAQLEVHKITSSVLYRVRNESSQFIIDRLSELRGTFCMARVELIDRFIPDNSYYADEIQDILSNKDPLNAELAAIDDYISALKVIPNEPQEQFVKMIGPYQNTLRDVNFNLGNWVGECDERINAKRNALR
jgi:hypothetical protein